MLFKMGALAFHINIELWRQCLLYSNIAMDKKTMYCFVNEDTLSDYALFGKRTFVLGLFRF